METQKFRFKKICIFPETVYKELVIDFFIELAAQYDADLYLVVSRREEGDYYNRRYGDKISGLFFNRALLTDLLREDPQSGSLYEKAQEIEKEFKTKVMHSVIAHRHMGRGFALGAPYFQRSIFSEKAEYSKILGVMIKQYEFFEKLFQQHQIDLVIGGDKVVADVCRKLNIVHRYLAPYKHKTYAYWGINEFWESNVLKMKFDESGVSGDSNASKLETTYTDVIKEASREGSLVYAIREASDHIIRRLYWKFRRYEKAKGYLGRDELANIFRRWWRFKKIHNYINVSTGKLSGCDFVFFPLHLEPERAMATFSPEFFDQMFAILTISKELPAGKFLIVKEHLYAVKVRPAEYYKQLLGMRNVLFADPFEMSFEYIRNARAVVAITGTAGFEAAMMGKPVISFGQHNLYNILPHVHVVTGWNDIAKVLSNVFSDEGDEEKRKRIEDGNRFINAFKSISANIAENEDHGRAAIYRDLESALLMTLQVPHTNL